MRGSSPCFRSRTHGKDFFLFLFSNSSLPCATDLGTRQTNKFHRVPKLGHTANFDDIGRRATWRYVCHVPNGGTRQNVTALTDRDALATWPYLCRVPTWGTRQRIILPCTEVRAHGEASFCRGLYFGRVFCIWPTTKALFAVCPMVCARRTLRHTANYRFPVVIRPVLYS